MKLIADVNIWIGRSTKESHSPNDEIRKGEEFDVEASEGKRLLRKGWAHKPGTPEEEIGKAVEKPPAVKTTDKPDGNGGQNNGGQK